jgi:uncharacterized membrane protein
MLAADHNHEWNGVHEYMLRLSFIYPSFLWLLLLLVPLWLITLKVPRRLAPWRFWSSLALRTLLVLLLVLSLAGTQLVYGVDTITTVFLVDSSDSIPTSAQAQAEQFIRDALDHMRADDNAAVVVFGENALVERAPNSTPALGQLSSTPIVERTDIEEAIQLGLALFPADSQKRLVLLSDGGENIGRALEAARLAAAGNVPIDIVDLTLPEDAGEALVASLDVPAHVRIGQEVTLDVVVDSSSDQTAQVRILADQEIIVDQTQELVAGQNRFSVTAQNNEPGFRRYEVEIIPENDNRQENNRAAALVQVQGPPRVLLVASQPDEARNLEDALTSANIQAETVTPNLMPIDMAGMSEYESIVLVNVPANELPIQAMANLPSYVRDLGKGLVMIGGKESFGVGGYGRTPVEEALPVYMDVRDREERPNLALAFVIDKSGSMDACHCSSPNRRSTPLEQSGERKVDIAKEAVIQSSALLGERDTLGVVTFNESAHWALEATRGPTIDLVADAVSGVEPRGSTNVRAGLTAAEEMLENADARIKHIILLTDGWGGSGTNEDIAQRMREKGITLTVVAAGSGSANYLQELAQAGGGRYYPAEDMSEVPEIFLQETITAVGNYIIEEPFFPTVVGDSPVLSGFTEGFPRLFGYNGSTLKDTARIVMVAEDESPLLAQWQYGLGRSIAWTSDTKGQWARNWVNWDGFPRFTAQLVGWVVPEQSNQQVVTNIHVEGAQTVIDVAVQDTAGTPHEDLQMTATVIKDGDTREEVLLTQVAPGQYRASIPSPSPDTYLVQLAGRQDGRAVVQDVAGLVIPYSPEYRQNQSNPLLLDQLRELTAGTRLTSPEEAFAHNLSGVVRAQEIALPLVLLALLLLPVDIAMRRLLLRRSDLSAARTWVQNHLPRRDARPTATPDPTLERLSSARRRAGRTASPNQWTSDTAKQSEPAAKGDAAERPEAAEREPGVQQQPTTSEQSPATGKSEPDPAAGSGSLERLRAAKERARRRSRGEQ